MREKIKTFFSICVLVVAVPYIITLLFQRNETSMKHEGIQEQIMANQEEALAADGTEIDLEEYLAGIVAKEIPLNYQPEAIKAQIVIARTELMASLNTKEQNLPESMSREEMLELWGQEGFEKNYMILETGIRDTEGEVLTCQGNLINPAYHAVSAGMTRNAQEALGQELPYLASVDSSMDIPSEDYLKVIFLEKSDFVKKLTDARQDIAVTEENIMENITITARDGADYVAQLQIGAVTMSGEEFRNALGLNSACFYIKEVDGTVRIVTKGLGHGLGLSQYGANVLAKEGKNYQEILNYYYSGIEIGKEQ